MEFEAYLDDLASGEPTPGGGSAASLTAALGAALLAMVARITRESPKHAEGRADADGIVAEADALRGAFLAAREQDERAYRGVVAAQALPRGTDAEKAARTGELQAALARAAAAPLHLAELVTDGLALAARTAALDNPHLMSDVTCAVAFLRAAFAAAVANVEINHRYLKDAAIVEAQRARLAELNARIA